VYRAAGVVSARRGALHRFDADNDRRLALPRDPAILRRMNRSALLVLVPFLATIGCGSSDDGTAATDATGTGGSTVATGGAGGKSGSGTGGTASGGKAGSTSQGGGTTAGAGGASSAGNGGSATAGSGGSATAGSGGSATAGSGGSATAGSGGSATAGSGGSGMAGSTGAAGRGFPATAPWASFYGPASGVDLVKLASTFRVINLDADPDGANITPAQITQLKNGGKNRVISYLNVGSCESYRSYWTSAPGFTSCNANTAAKIGPYSGYPDETWMNVGNAEYQKLIVGYVAPRLIAQGVDGFFLDNLEIVEHGTSTTNGPCDKACSQGGLDLVRKLREAFPDKLIVMQNGTSDVTRLGTTGGISYPTLLDGISHEEVFVPLDSTSESELLAWKNMGLKPGGQQFFIGTEDYVSSCTATAAAKPAYDKSTADGFSPYVSDASASMQSVCFWPWL
jgi:cysteinyl-tRNA synthetase